MINKLPIIGVMGSAKDAHPEKSEPLGRWIAKSGFHLLTGGGAGVMQAVSKAFCGIKNRKGISIGIIPGYVQDNKYFSLPGYPNPWIEIPIYTHLPLSGPDGLLAQSRNHINILSAHIVVALAGSHGTASEVKLAIKYNKPVLGYINSLSEIPGLTEHIPYYPKLADLTKAIENIFLSKSYN